MTAPGALALAATVLMLTVLPCSAAEVDPWGLTLEDATEIFYQMSEYYTPKSVAGIRWDDPAFSVAWPVEPAVISERDSGFADYRVRT